MSFSGVLGHHRSIEILKNAMRSDRVSHAYLFQGPGGVGKRMVADAFAAALLCESTDDQEACGSCGSCARFEAGNHPDSHILEVPEGKSRIPIEAFHALEADLQLTPHGGRRRVAIVDPADLLSREAQHAFLKTLEEPRPDTIIILITARPSALPGTIISRCQRVGFGAIPQEVLGKALASRLGIDREKAQLLAGIARGSMGRAQALNQDQAFEARDGMLEVASAAIAGVIAPAVEWSESFRGTEQERDRAVELLDLLMLEARDVMILASGGRKEDLAHRDRAEATARRASLPGAAEEAARAFGRIAQTQRDIRRNVNPALALQGMFADLSPRTIR